MLCFLLLGSAENSAVSDQKHEVYETKREESETHVEQDGETYPLINYRENRRSQEHTYPTDYVQCREYKFVFINTFKISDVHAKVLLGMNLSTIFL